MGVTECKSDLPMDYLRCLGSWGHRGFIEPLKPSLQYPVRTPWRGQSVRELSVKNDKLLCCIHSYWSHLKSHHRWPLISGSKFMIRTETQQLEKVVVLCHVYFAMGKRKGKVRSCEKYTFVKRHTCARCQAPEREEVEMIYHVQRQDKEDTARKVLQMIDGK